MGIANIVSLAGVAMLFGCTLFNEADSMRCAVTCEDCKKVVMECISTEGSKIDQVIKKRKIL